MPYTPSKVPHYKMKIVLAPNLRKLFKMTNPQLPMPLWPFLPAYAYETPNAHNLANFVNMVVSIWRISAVAFSTYSVVKNFERPVPQNQFRKIVYADCEIWHIGYRQVFAPVPPLTQHIQFSNPTNCAPPPKKKCGPVCCRALSTLLKAALLYIDSTDRPRSVQTTVLSPACTRHHSHPVWHYL